MKKLFFIAALAGAAAITSCSNNDPATFSYGSTVLCYAVAEGEEPTISKGEFLYEFNLTDETLRLSASKFKVGDRTVGFITPSIKYTSKYFASADNKYCLSGSYYTANASTTEPLGQGSPSVTDVDIALTNSYFVVPTPFPGVAEGFTSTGFPILKFTVGHDWTVRTFPQDAYYGGQTLSEYQDAGQQVNYVSPDNTYYRVIFRTDASGNVTGKADLVIYNAKWAEKMPAIVAMALKDLDVNFTATGYEINATDLIPSVVMDGKVIENPAFPFNSLSIKSDFNSLTRLDIDFTVAGRFHGTSRPSYLPF